jgi:hypothetical protein
MRQGQKAEGRRVHALATDLMERIAMLREVLQVSSAGAQQGAPEEEPDSINLEKLDGLAESAYSDATPSPPKLQITAKMRVLLESFAKVLDSSFQDSLVQGQLHEMDQEDKDDFEDARRTALHDIVDEVEDLSVSLAETTDAVVTNVTRGVQLFPTQVRRFAVL